MIMVEMIGSAFGKGAQIQETGKGPLYLRDAFDFTGKVGAACRWRRMVGPYDEAQVNDEMGRNYKAVLDHNTALAKEVSEVVTAGSFPVIVGGDHSCGIGTWSGVTSAMGAEGKFGLIWFDAHMDAHTIETSPSKAHHGMPLSSLLGHGDKALGGIGSDRVKISPEHLVVIGIRSYEPAERALLESLGIRIVYMEELKERGMAAVMKEAHSIITNGTKEYGISVDLDFFDPKYTPGVGSPEAGGPSPEEFLSSVGILFSDRKMRALEITEFNPDRDVDDKTANVALEIVIKLIETK